jgi:tetratricopeptide (TPR) repeat protein
MKNFFVRALVTFILPLILIIILFNINILLGLLSLISYLLYTFYSSRAGIFTAIGSANFGKGNNEKAMLWLEKAYQTGKMSPTSIASYAYIQLKIGLIDNSENLLKKALQLKISDEYTNQVKSILALVYWKRQRLDEAIELLEEVMKNFKTTNIYGSLGYFLVLKGDLEKALAFNLEAYDYNSSDKIIQDNLGQTYLMLEQYEKAKEIYESLILTNPTFPEAYFNFGLLCEKMDQHERAIELYNRALSSKFSYLSTLTKEQIQSTLDELNAACLNEAKD